MYGTSTKTDLLIILAITIGSFFVFAQFDVLEQIVVISKEYEAFEIDELVASAMVFSTCMLVFALKQMRVAKQINEQLHKQNQELQEAMSRIKVLEGTITTCSYCKKVMDSAGEWHQMETYIDAHSEAQFSHGYCPSCLKKVNKDIEHYTRKDT